MKHPVIQKSRSILQLNNIHSSNSKVSSGPSKKIHPKHGGEEETRDCAEDNDNSDSDDIVENFFREGEVNLVVQQHLIDVILNTWAIHDSRAIFDSSISTKSSGIGKRPMVPESRIVGYLGDSQPIQEA
uniref:Uncharacterized protein n=1 Tax=Solanum tuberosum TaxID=4113 RepID=M1DZK6_SOLTU